MPHRTLLALLIASAPLGAAAADDGLYAPAPPPNAAFVRVVHAAAGSPAFEADLAGRSLDALSYRQASPYVVLAQGEHKVDLGPAPEQSLQVQAGAFYTLALVERNGQPTMVSIADPINTNLARCQLALYNLTEAPTAGLMTGDGATPIVVDVTPDAVGQRAVNPLKIDLAATIGEARVDTFPGVQLERSRAYSIMVMGAIDAPTATWIENTTSTE